MSRLHTFLNVTSVDQQLQLPVQEVLWNSTAIHATGRAQPPQSTLSKEGTQRLNACHSKNVAIGDLVRP